MFTDNDLLASEIKYVLIKISQWLTNLSELSEFLHNFNSEVVAILDSNPCLCKFRPILSFSSIPFNQMLNIRCFAFYRNNCV